MNLVLSCRERKDLDQFAKTEGSGCPGSGKPACSSCSLTAGVTWLLCNMGPHWASAQALCRKFSGIILARSSLDKFVF